MTCSCLLALAAPVRTGLFVLFLQKTNKCCCFAFPTLISPYCLVYPVALLSFGRLCLLYPFPFIPLLHALCFAFALLSRFRCLFSHLSIPLVGTLLCASLYLPCDLCFGYYNYFRATASLAPLYIFYSFRVVSSITQQMVMLRLVLAGIVSPASLAIPSCLAAFTLLYPIYRNFVSP